MDSSDFVAAAAFAFVVSFQAWVTFRVWRSKVFERPQKVAQSKLIWLLPALGAVMVFSVLSTEERAVREGPQLRL